MSQKQLNIILILSDEQHDRTVGCHRSEPLSTPNLDALAADGAQFEHAYCCSSICFTFNSR